MRIVVTIFMIGSLLACSGKREDKTRSSESVEDWESWKVKRIEKLKSTWGYLNLAGLYWLSEGENTFGSDSTNDIVFPEMAPEVIGSFSLENGSVTFRSALADVEVDSMVQQEALVFDPLLEERMLMRRGRFLWYVLERGGKIGVRLLDLDHPKLKQAIEIGYFDFNPEFIVDAVYEEFPIPKQVPMTDVLGIEYITEIPGQLKFKLRDQPYTLDVMPEGDELFVIFSDETSAVETYGSGRYMYTANPGTGGTTVLNFNKSYNPPCAFTDFATCLIPPAQNRLATRIEAGELDYH